jgi:hypothetical protein
LRSPFSHKLIGYHRHQPQYAARALKLQQ